MWQDIKLVISGVYLLFLLVLLFMVGHLIWDSRFLAAVAMLFSFIALAYTRMLDFNPDIEVIQALGMVILVFAAMQAFQSSDATDMDLQLTNEKLFMEFAQINYCPADLQPDESKRYAFKELRNIAVKKCGMQGHSDLFDLTVDLLKANHLSIEIGLMDTIHTEYFKDNQKVKCIDLAWAANQLCPNLLQTNLKKADKKDASAV